MEELNNGYLSKDGKVVLDFLQAIHAAEQRQAELDGRAFAEEKRALKVWIIFMLGIDYHVHDLNHWLTSTSFLS